MFKLKQYQIKGHDELVNILSKGSTALELSGTGMGKTYIALAVAKTLGLKVAVVCPKIVCPMWKEVADLAGVETLFVLNYEKIRGNKPTKAGGWAKGKRHFEWAVGPDTLLIFDECHRAKSYKTKNCKMLVSAANYDCRKLFISATIANDPRHLQAPGSCIGLFEPKKHWNWCQSMGVYRGVFGFDYKGTPAEIKKMHDLLAPFTHRERTEDIEGFPANHVEALAIETGHAKKIDKYIKKLMELKEDDEELPIVEMLRQRQEIELLKVKSIVEMTEELVNEQKSVVIFVNFIQTIDALVEHLSPGCAAVVQGNQSDTDRAQMIDAFQRNVVTVIIVQIQAGGVGLSLHDLHGRQRVSLICPTWSAVDLIQCLGRINRSGALSPAIQKIIFAAGSMEERVRKKVNEKVSQIDQLNDGDVGYE